MQSYKAINIQQTNTDDEFKSFIKSFQQEYQLKVLNNSTTSSEQQKKSEENSTSLLSLLFKEYDSINDLMKDFSHQLKNAI
ncbi:MULTISPECIES: hypothetical protein [unclassified Tenacibaculum]|uniref:hypothetical protein n=1 Tax=unclassified Tenacibaculum TaxID=2635139 RepID=UPI001F2BF241|nr:MULTISPECIES: hypothetical protein [unclassified Tenacibaculum]MCF2873844.1 hypothetical protein [Tenacibaculum sp. Cn5-1]MCF2936654.1 hypothetical protein [Tenacibaculum sp. Cn5-34]MCG7512878.1 hypothetical protein [Tenacibaculum sp. Cn5-46]